MFCFNRSFCGAAFNWQECCHQLSLWPWNVSSSFVSVVILVAYICDNETCLYTVNKTGSEVHFEEGKRATVACYGIKSD